MFVTCVYKFELHTAVRAGLDAMIVEGARVAIVTVPTCRDDRGHAPPRQVSELELLGVLETALDEQPKEPKEPGAISPIGPQERANFGMKSMAQTYATLETETQQVLSRVEIPALKTRRDYFSLIVVSTDAPQPPDGPTFGGTQARFV